MVPRPGYGLKSSTLPTRNGYVSTSCRLKCSFQQKDYLIFSKYTIVIPYKFKNKIKCKSFC